MRKKLLFLALFALILCLFVISASAFEVDGLYYSINSDGKTVTLNSENREKGTLVNVVIPETVQYDNNNDGINETYVVTTIGEASFGHKDYAVNSPVETVFIPKTVSTINSHAFRNLQNLKSLVVEASGYDSETGLTKEVKLYNAEFLGCSNLVTVDLSKSNITQIGSYAFRDCTSLKEVKLPESIQALGGECFKNCPSLEKINLPRTITSIGGSSFWGNTKMTGDYIFDYLSSLGNHAFRETSITSIVILDGAFTSPGSDAAFYNCKNLQYVVLPDSVESFASHTFTNCSSLKYVVVSENLKSSNSAPGNACIIVRGNNTENVSGAFSSYPVAPFSEFNPESPAQKAIYYGAIENPSKAGSYVDFTGYDKPFSVWDVGSTSKTSYEAIFTPVGYSINPTNTGFSAGFQLNKSSLEAYESLFKKDVKFGIVIFNPKYLNGDSFFSNGILNASAGAIQVETDTSYSTFSLSVEGFAADHVSLELVSAGYVYTEEDKSDVEFFQKQYEGSQSNGVFSPMASKVTKTDAVLYTTKLSTISNQVMINHGKNSLDEFAA